jgi:hypothetical protein
MMPGAISRAMFFNFLKLKNIRGKRTGGREKQPKRGDLAWL